MPSAEGQGQYAPMLAAVLEAWLHRLALESPGEVDWVRRWSRKYAPEAGRQALSDWLSETRPGPVTAASGRAALHGVYLAVCERLGPGVADRTLGEAIRQAEASRNGGCSPRDLL